MKEEYINAFLAPEKMVWDRELGQTLEFDTAEMASDQFTSEDVTAIIGISGKLEGTVLYGFPQDTVKAVVATMVGEDAEGVTDELGLSALGESANMITGNAATKLAQEGYPCDISPPVIIEPMGSRFTTLSGPQILVKFKSDLGMLTVRISLNEARPRD